MIKDPEAYDYLNWLCKITGCISVWDRFYYGKANDRQIEALKKLSQKEYSKISCSLYQGSYEASR